MSRNLTILAIVALFCFVVLGLAWAVRRGPFRDPQDALLDFCSGEDRAEDQLMDPLILAGFRVRSLVIRNVADIQMCRRRYAILYLGCADVKDSLPVLIAILENEEEPNYFRCDALEAISLIDPRRGQALANNYTETTHPLSKCANAIVNGHSDTRCRTWSDAFFHRHD